MINQPSSAKSSYEKLRKVPSSAKSSYEKLRKVSRLCGNFLCLTKEKKAIKIYDMHGQLKHEQNLNTTGTRPQEQNIAFNAPTGNYILWGNFYSSRVANALNNFHKKVGTRCNRAPEGELFVNSILKHNNYD